VLGAQAAKAERFHRFRQEQQKVIDRGDEDFDRAYQRGRLEARFEIDLRLAALNLAHDAGTLPGDVVARAEAYLAFITKGETNG
jgi:hypothetical protein